jgi:NADPH:quinone reductase-like Zn-dependent oxidoreductase
VKAIVYNKKDSGNKLELREVEKSLPGDNEVLVKVHAVSLNAADYRSMKMGIIPKGRVFGADVAGHVESAGKNITRFKPGDEVFGDLGSFGFGGLAEYVSVPERALGFKPAQISFEEAAALPMAALTALQALRDKGNIRKGDKVLIVGSAGGVGTFAVQLARFFGAEITGVCSSRNMEQTRSLGADHVIDYTIEDFTVRKVKYNLILGINGNYPILSYLKSLAPGGIYVMVGGSLSQIFKSLVFGKFLSLGSRKMKSVAAKANQKDLDLLSGLLANGRIRAVIDRTYPFEKGSEAIEYISQGHSSGKVVIIVEPTAKHVPL